MAHVCAICFIELPDIASRKIGVTLQTTDEQTRMNQSAEKVYLALLRP